MKDKKAIPLSDEQVKKNLENKESQDNQVNAVPEEEQEIEVIKKESKVKKVFNIIINVVLVVAIVLAAISTYLAFVEKNKMGTPSIFGLQILSVKTDSMYPTLKPGDLIFAFNVTDTSTLEKGDIITYWTVINGQRELNTHRIEEIFVQDGQPLFATKGDNNPTADPLNVHRSNVVGKYFARIPGLGKAADFMKDKYGFLIMVVIPVFIFFVYYLVQFFRVLFEYQNVKNRIKYEQERGRTEDLLAEQQRKDQQRKDQERAAMEAELREKLKAELLASMKAEQAAETAAEETVAEE